MSTEDDDYLEAVKLQLSLLEESCISEFGKYGVNSTVGMALDSFKVMLQQEIQIIDDKRTALTMSEDLELSDQLQSIHIRERAPGAEISEVDNGKMLNDNQAGPSGDNSLHHPQNPSCISCDQNFSADHTFACPCSHTYCQECLKSIYERCLSDRSLIPARCCKQPFPDDWMPKILEADAQQQRYRQFQHSIKEVSIPDVELASVMLQNGWQSCSNCGFAIEKKDGCNHMTCICGHQLCYLCGKDWCPRSCTCALFLHDELEAHINVIAPDAGLIERNRLRNLYQNHDAHAHNWVRREINGRNKRCQGCPWVCNLWYFHCYGCSMNYCSSCRFNRG